MSQLVANERRKLAANLLNTAASTCFAVGIATPLAAFVYNLGGVGTALGIPTLVTGMVVWLLACAALHFAAQVVLGGLKG